MTDISNRAIIPQVNEPLGYVDGKPLYPTVAWQQFLEALWKRTGGFRDGLFDEVIRSLVEASETRGALASVESLTRALESLAQANDADIRQTIEAARREIRAEAESTRAEVQSALAALGELARRDFITPDDINVATLSAISANIGTITAGTIQGVLFEAVGDGDDAIAIEPDQPWVLWSGDKTIAPASRTIANSRVAIGADGKFYRDGFEENQTFSSGTHGTSVVVTILGGVRNNRVVRRLQLNDTRDVNRWLTTKSIIDLTGAGDGTYRWQMWLVDGAQPTRNPGDVFDLSDIVQLFERQFEVVGGTVTNHTNSIPPEIFLRDYAFGILDGTITVPGNPYLYITSQQITGNTGDTAIWGTATNLRCTNTVNKNVT
jgi:hypothetical protein